jgi:hypothetical protein
MPEEKQRGSVVTQKGTGYENSRLESESQSQFIQI